MYDTHKKPTDRRSTEDTATAERMDRPLIWAFMAVCKTDESEVSIGNLDREDVALRDTLAEMSAADALRAAIRAASEGLVEREILVELTVLAAVAREHLLVIGPPGTAKSEAVRRAARAFEARYFEYLLGRFTEPSELVGPIDLRRLREGVVETETSGMLPEAELAFLDEVFLGSTAILNTLLSLLHERTFRRGRTTITVPLRVCVAASNGLPEDEALAAFADRFLLRAFVEPVPDAMLETLLQRGDALATTARVERTHAKLADLDVIAEAAREVDVAPVRSDLAEAVRLLRKGGIALSDRRIVKLQRLVAAAAAIDGRARADARDLWPIVYAVPTAEAQVQARAILAPLVRASASGALEAAALEASRGPDALAARLAREADEVLAATPAGEAERRQRELRVEALLREIDASFASESRPVSVSDARKRLSAVLAPA
jgi:MoxR-like ATPase